MAEPTTSATTAGVALLLKLAPGAIGSLLSLRFVGQELSFGKRVTTFVAGTVVAYFVTPLVTSRFGIGSPDLQAAMGFLVGLFGLSIVGEGFKAISSGALMSIVKNRFGGGQS
ncbi:holin [Burkholderia cenocepacia]|uniref:holin n=1 Tax=Burkholderia cenocepacia TaxID=95486 RepID=UPI00223227FA|nr:holin [Burkholderia cenocepacia]MCW3539340.1 holin [Burkholderia cenocepacia]